ncbi:MAG: NUDIX domain-containing protein [Ruminococcus sp.]|uniref:NUDIX hydrolase n=1 Tax=Ruminococcus sp. TaxID=41978 RepID=UPI0025EA6A57|nr:NUDIX domain-containing protein [Ruminococcus sp.]MBO4867569.1 NUDIX domain-containing protein [Ruminococcus sp.]
MNEDMTAVCGDGLINIRVCAIIPRTGFLLMACNDHSDYLYTVGGRVKFGETAEQAIVREVFEETGIKLDIDRLGFIQENYFYGDAEPHMGKLIYEVAFYFYMKVPEDFEPVGMDFKEGDTTEHLCWIDPMTEKRRFYPEFFRTELFEPFDGVKHMVQDDR